MGLKFTKESMTNCPVHSIPYYGLCAEENCNLTGLICLKCQPQACTETLKHQKISVDEFYEKFLKKLVNSVDFKKLKNFIEQVNKQKNKHSDQLKGLASWQQELITKKLSKFDDRIKEKVEKFKERINNELKRIDSEYNDANSRFNFANLEVPNFTLEEIVKLIEKNKGSNIEMENMASMIKKFSDNEKLVSNRNDMETLIYSKNLNESIQINSTLTEKIQDVQQAIDNKFDLLIKNMFPYKGEQCIFSIREKPFSTNPATLVFKEDLSIKGQKSYTIDSVFAVFIAVDGNTYLATGDSNSPYNIEVINLKTKAIKLLSGHTQHIYIVRHFLQRKTSIDYLISTSSEKNCKIWNLQTYTCYLTLSSCHSGLYLYSALLLFDDHNNQNYIVTSSPNEFMKLWDFSTGKLIREIGNSNDYTYFINSWYSNKEIYIVNANSVNVKLYNIKEPKGVYRVFQAQPNTWHMSAFVEKIGSIDMLFESDGNGYIRIWKIESKILYKTIIIPQSNLRGICFWNETYIIAASSTKNAVIIDITKDVVVGNLTGHTNVLCSVMKINHPLYGESLITAAIDSKVKLWIHPNK